MTRTELAWAAGLFDGEGSIFYYNHSKTRRRPKGIRGIGLVVGQSGDPTVLVRFMAAVNCGQVSGPRKKKPSTHSHRLPVYQFWARSFEEIQWVIVLLWKYLSEPKRQQARRALKAYVADTRRPMTLPFLGKNPRPRYEPLLEELQEA